MKSVVTQGCSSSRPLLLAVGIAALAQDSRADATTDPRVGLKPGLNDAGVAARNMELVRSLPKPPGFFDPKAPAGEPTPPEKPRARRRQAAAQPPAGRPVGTAPAAGRHAAA